MYIFHRLYLISEEEEETNIDDFFSEVTKRKRVQVKLKSVLSEIPSMCACSACPRENNVITASVRQAS